MEGKGLGESGQGPGGSTDPQSEIEPLGSPRKRPGKAPELPAGNDVSFVERLKRRFGKDLDPEISLQDDPGEEEPDETVSKGLYLKLSNQDPASMRFTIRGEIARGGMGAVLRVWDDDLRRNLAMKVLLSRHSVEEEVDGPPPPSDELLGRFLEEAQITGQLDHPGIVPVHDLGIDERGRVYFTMRLVRGRDLKQMFDLEQDGKLDWSRTKALGVILKVCEAMAFAHSKGVVHRDLKPANIMVGRFGETYVMDWGLARVLGRRDSRDMRIKSGTDSSLLSLVQTARQEDHESDPQSPLVTMDGDVIGTPSYMSPEQAEGRLEDVGPRSDVYSLGSILYQMLSGQAPYVPPGSKMSPHTVLAKAIEGPPTPITKLNKDVAGELVAICEKAMQRDPQMRYASMLDMAADIEAYLEGRVVGAYEGGSVAEARKWVQRNQGMAASIGVAALLAIGGLASVAALQASKSSELGEKAEELEKAVTRAEEGEADAMAAMKLAIDNEEEATQAREEADEAAASAKENEDIARRRGYQASLAAVDYSLRLNEIGEARRRLELCDEDLRGWEWHHLWMSLANSYDNTSEVAGKAYDLDFTSDGRVSVVALTGDHRVFELTPETASLEEVSQNRLWPWAGNFPDRVETSFSADGRRVAILGQNRQEALIQIRGAEVFLEPTPEGAEEVEDPLAMTLPEDPEALGLTEVRCVEFAPSGPLLAAGYEDGLVAIWNVETREVAAYLDEHVDTVNDLAWSPDGRFLVTVADDHNIAVWNAELGEILRLIEGHEGPVESVAVSGDGYLFATAARDNRVRIWDVRTGRQTRDLPWIVGHTGTITDIVFGPDNRYLASASADMTVRVVDLKTEEQKVFLGHEGEVMALGFSPDGTVLVSAGEEGAIRTWDPATEGAATNLFEEGLSFVSSVAFLPDGVRCATGHHQGEVVLWDAWSGQVRAVMRGHENKVESLAISPDGKRMLTGARDKTAILWDLEKRTPLETLRGHTRAVMSVAISPDGELLATSSSDKSARIWRAGSGEPLHVLTGHRRQVTGVVFSADGGRVWTGSADGSIRLWDVSSGELVDAVEDVGSSIAELVLGPDGTRIYAGTSDGRILAFDTTSLEPVFATPPDEDFGVTALAIDHAGQRLVSGAGIPDGVIRVWDASSGDILLTLWGHPWGINDLAFSPDDERLLSGSSRVSFGFVDRTRPKDRIASIWETGSLESRREKRRRALELREEVDPVVANLFSTYFYMNDVVAQLEQERMSDEARRAAIAMALVRGDNARRLANESWTVIAGPDADATTYDQALDRAEAAVAMDPSDSYCTVILGGAQLRRGLLPAARRTLESVRIQPNDDPRVTVLASAFLAMTEFGLGDEAEARARLQGVRPTGTLEQDLQLIALVEEARALCGLAPLTATPSVPTDSGAGSLGTSDGSGAGSTAAPAAGSDG